MEKKAKAKPAGGAKQRRAARRAAAATAAAAVATEKRCAATQMQQGSSVHVVSREVEPAQSVPIAQSTAEMIDDEPSGLGWLPDGSLLIVAMETQQLRRITSDGVMAVHADLSSVARGSLNDMIVASDGTAYVGDMGHRIQDGGERRPGQTIAVRSDGSWFVAADDLESPNGHILTPDEHTLLIAESAAARVTAFDRADDGTLSNRRIYAALQPSDEGPQFAPPDGICLDAEGAVWVADPIGARVFRALPSGETTHEYRIEGLIPVACVLGGRDRQTLLICAAADWRRNEVRKSPSGIIAAIDVEIPGVGRP